MLRRNLYTEAVAAEGASSETTFSR
jgi:hypothetical protein